MSVCSGAQMDFLGMLAWSSSHVLIVVFLGSSQSAAISARAAWASSYASLAFVRVCASWPGGAVWASSQVSLAL